MLRFTKILVLLIMFISLIGCSSNVSGVSSSEFKEAEKVVNIIDKHFNNMTELSQEDRNYIEVYLEDLIESEDYLNNEGFYLQVSKLYTSYDMAIGLQGLLDENAKDFVEHYKTSKNDLIENYNISFENTDK